MRFLIALLLMGCHSSKEKEPFLENAIPASKTDRVIVEVPVPLAGCEGGFPTGYERYEYSFDPTTQDVGECRSAVRVCLDGAWYYQELERGPQKEVCSGRDDDCDGVTDNGVAEEGLSCGDFDADACLDYRFSCKDGKLQCLELPGPFPEICNNGIDEDCDGEDQPCPTGAKDICDGIDNDLDGETDELAEAAKWCYTGPVGTQGIGECRSGFYPCVNGEIDTSECVGEVVPQNEYCDNLDNNCNNDTDEGFGSLEQPVDIVFAIDVSGSMDVYIAALKDSISNFAMSYNGNPIFRFAIVAIGGDFDPYYWLYHDLSSFTDFEASLMGLTIGGSVEPTYDVVSAIVDASNPLMLSWSQNSRIVILLFGDEDGEGYETTTQQAVKAALEAADAVLYSFVTKRQDYDLIMGDDFVFPLDGDTIAVQVETALNDICVEQ